MSEVTMNDILRAAVEWYEYRGSVFQLSLQPLIERYADQKADKAFPELREELAQLRDQLANALVPKFKVGDEVRLYGSEDITKVADHAVRYELSDYTGWWYERDLSPVEPKCQHGEDAGNFMLKPYLDKFCRDCGERLG